MSYESFRVKGNNYLGYFIRMIFIAVLILIGVLLLISIGSLAVAFVIKNYIISIVVFIALSILIIKFRKRKKR